MSKIVKIEGDSVYFDDGYELWSEHDQDCCESHYLNFSAIEVKDVEDLEFNLAGDFFERVEDFGIRLLPVNGHPVPIPGYGYNNGYYGSNILMLLADKDRRDVRSFDVSECQVIDG